MLGEVNQALDDLAGDDDLRILVFSTSTTDALSAGADVAEELDKEAGVARMEAFAGMYARVSGFPLPTICVCVGHCVGAGAELAAGCDLRVAGENMKARWVGARPTAFRSDRLPGLRRSSARRPAKDLIFTAPRARRRGGRADRLRPLGASAPEEAEAGRARDWPTELAEPPARRPARASSACSWSSAARPARRGGEPRARGVPAQRQRPAAPLVPPCAGRSRSLPLRWRADGRPRDAPRCAARRRSRLRRSNLRPRRSHRPRSRSARS